MDGIILESLHKDRKSQKERAVDLYRTHVEDSMRNVCAQEPYRAFRVNRYTASDVEIYDVLSTTHGSNALYLLASGLRTRDEALSFFVDHGLERLISDHQSIVRKALERNIPADYALKMMSMYGSQNCEEDYYIDALEANGVRALRDTEGYRYYPTVPDLVMRQEINLSDIRTIGATYLKKASRIACVTEQLKKIKSGKSAYDAATMKKLLDKIDPSTGYNLIQFPDVLMMANAYGVETVLGLAHVERSASFATKHLKGTDHTDAQKSEIIAFEDALSRRMVTPPAPDEIIDLYDTGLSVRDVMQKLVIDRLTVSQIIASQHGVKLVISDGWL